MKSWRVQPQIGLDRWRLVTIGTVAAEAQFEGNGTTTVFSYFFVADAASDLTVYYSDINGNVTELLPSQYTVYVNPPPSTGLWGIGGTLTYPLSGSPIATGTYLTVVRNVPETQEITISNQGVFYPQTVERALDVLCLEIQQAFAALNRAVLVPIGSPLTPLQYLQALIAALIPAGGSSPSTGNLSTITNSYSIGPTDVTILANAAGGAISVTLPSPLTYFGRFLNIKKIDASTNAVSLSGSVDGSSTYSLNFTNQSVTLQGAGTFWAVL